MRRYWYDVSGKLRICSRFALYRVIASRWEFVRTEKGWKVERRINQLLDGREEARLMLAQGIAESRGTASQE